MSKHRPKTPADAADAAAKADIAAAVRTAQAELDRRSDYSSLRYIEGRIAELSGVPGDPPYVERFSDFPKS